MPLALVVGAGIGGMAAGLALRRAGWDIRIFERAAAPRAIGFALGLAPNASAALRQLGVGRLVTQHGFAPTSAEFRRLDGSVIRRFSQPPDATPAGDVMRLILRPALHDALLDALGPGVVEPDRAAVRFHETGTGVRVQFADGTDATGDILIGADGIGSIVRAQLHPGEAPPRASGYFAIRGLSPAVDRLNGLHAIWYLGRGAESGLVQTAPDAIYWFVSLFADDVRAGAIDVQEVMRRCTSTWDAQFRAITGATAAEDMRIDELFVREPLARWGSGRVTLLGDAAHPMLPHTGQGAAQALEDAVVLGRALHDAGDPVAALRRYEAVRGPQTRRIVRMGPRIARMTTTRSAALTALRDTALRLIPERAIVRAFTQPGGASAPPPVSGGSSREEP